MKLRKLDQVKEDLAAARKRIAAKTRTEKGAAVVDGAIEVVGAAPGGMLAAGLDYKYGENGEAHRVGPLPTNIALGLVTGIVGCFFPRKLRMVGAGVRGVGAGMVGYGAGRAFEERLAAREEEEG